MEFVSPSFTKSPADERPSDRTKIVELDVFVVIVRDPLREIDVIKADPVTFI